MEFSYVDGKRRTPQPGLGGVCDLCNGETISKCGNVRIHHWAHLRRHNCDPWWENETEWHREWKREFPEYCREVCVTSNDGKKHRADVKTDSGRVIEFQHSPIKMEERQKREAFYEEMIWVVNGLRLPSFVESFKNQLGRASVLQNAPIKLSVPQGNCSILKTWANSTVGVYLDFGDATFTDTHFNFSSPTLWRLYPGNLEPHVEIAPVWRDDFILAAYYDGSIQGIHDPDMQVSRIPQRWKPEANPQRRDPSANPERRKSETDLEYSLRVILGIDGND